MFVVTCVRFGPVFVEVCVTVCLVCVETCVSFGLEFAEYCLEPLFLNFGKALHLGQYQVLGTVLIPKQDKWNF